MTWSPKIGIRREKGRGKTSKREEPDCNGGGCFRLMVPQVAFKWPCAAVNFPRPGSGQDTHQTIEQMGRVFFILRRKEIGWES